MLAGDNYEAWFRRYKIKLKGKEVCYVCEQTCVQYCKVATVGDLTDALEELDITDSKEN